MTRRRRRTTAGSLALATGLLVTGLGASASAQRIAGVVRDSLTGEPIVGAVVSVLDSAGGVLARNLSDADGRFSLGRFARTDRLSVLRIGYAPRSITLASGDSLVNVGMRVIPAELSTLTASTRRICPGDSGGGQALALWEQVRSALLATTVSRQLNPPRVGVMSFARRRDPVEKRIEEETRTSRFVVSSRGYVAARPAWAFAYDGYMREEANGERLYYAPDEAVLLDETFASTHCMRAVAGGGKHAGEVGIAFDPIETDGRDTLVDVKGTLWVDRGIRALRTFEFSYTGLEPMARGSGGDLTFGTMPNGTQIVQRWQIRSSILATDVERNMFGAVRRLPPRPERSNVRLLGYQETGGEIASVEWEDGTRWRAAYPQYRGIVVDSLSRPVSGAVVRLANRTFDDSLITDASGRFNFPPVMLGFYRLYVTDSLFAHYGFSSRPRSLLLGPDDEDVVLTPRSRTELLMDACGRAYVNTPGKAVILGRVVGVDGEPATDVRVDASWRGTVRRVTTDDAGRFAICGAALHNEVDVNTSTRRHAASLRLPPVHDDVMGVTLVLRPKP